MTQRNNRARLLSLIFALTIALSSVAVIKAQSQLLTDTTVIHFGPTNSTAPPDECCVTRRCAGRSDHCQG
jgi:hypothetical protein